MESDNLPMLVKSKLVGSLTTWLWRAGAWNEGPEAIGDWRVSTTYKGPADLPSGSTGGLFLCVVGNKPGGFRVLLPAAQ